MDYCDKKKIKKGVHYMKDKIYKVYILSEPAITDTLNTIKTRKRCLIFLCLKKNDTKKMS